MVYGVWSIRLVVRNVEGVTSDLANDVITKQSSDSIRYDGAGSDDEWNDSIASF
jgi:hypothetical protein